MNFFNDEVILQYIENLTGKSRSTVGYDSQVYYDLDISGDDFDELIQFLCDEYGTDFRNFNSGHYAPPEGAFSFRGVFNILRGKAPFRQLSVGDLIAAVKRGAWE